jgi:hypothetical protein
LPLRLLEQMKIEVFFRKALTPFSWGACCFIVLCYCAVLCCAVLCCVVLCCVVLRCAVLCCVMLQCSALRRSRCSSARRSRPSRGVRCSYFFLIFLFTTSIYPYLPSIYPLSMSCRSAGAREPFHTCPCFFLIVLFNTSIYPLLPLRSAGAREPVCAEHPDQGLAKGHAGKQVRVLVIVCLMLVASWQTGGRRCCVGGDWVQSHYFVLVACNYALLLLTSCSLLAHLLLASCSSLITYAGSTGCCWRS